MKTSSYIIRSIVMFVCIVLISSCGNKQARQFSVVIKNTDGSKDDYTLADGSLLLVNNGSNYLVAKAVNGTDRSLEFQVVRYDIIRDSKSKTYTIKKAGDEISKLALAGTTQLDPTGSVQVSLTSIAMMDTGRRPKGACQGNCCEATCFSTFCCSDPDDCNNAPCDCKPTGNCPGDPSPQSSHFFELFRSGKDMLVVKG